MKKLILILVLLFSISIIASPIIKDYKVFTLKNGLEVIMVKNENQPIVTIEIAAKNGAYTQSPDNCGLSHLYEHMFFKGTQQRPTPADIARAIEGLGGYTNAATSQDYTFFYNRVPAKYSADALEVLADMINNSLFDETAIQREKGVILEELNMCLDTPTRYIYDLIMQTVWPHNPLGRDIIGARQTIQSIRRADFLRYLKRAYQPQNMVVSVAGNINHRQVVKQVNSFFGRQTNGRLLNYPRVVSKQKQPRLNLLAKKTDQAHLCLAVPALPRGHREETVLLVMDTILGSGMSSRLFLNIREKRGLCYSIHSFTEKFAETGILGVTAGLNLKQTVEAVRAILDEFKFLQTQPVSQAELTRAKEYLRGTLSLHMDDTDHMAMWYGAQALFYQPVRSVEDRIKQLLKIKSNDIIKLAQRLFAPQRLNLALIGPFEPSIKSKLHKLLIDYK